MLYALGKPKPDRIYITEVKQILFCHDEIRWKFYVFVSRSKRLIIIFFFFLFWSIIKFCISALKDFTTSNKASEWLSFFSILCISCCTSTAKAQTMWNVSISCPFVCVLFSQKFKLPKRPKMSKNEVSPYATVIATTAGNWQTISNTNCIQTKINSSSRQK